MVNISDVYAALCTYESAKGYTGEVLFPCCEQGLQWVRENLRPEADENSPLIISTAAAIADFYLFLKKQCETDSYESYKVGDMTINVAVASGTGNAKKLLNMVKNGELDVQFIEIMACPGGCVNGGGQPIQPANVRMNMDLRAVRAAVLYNDDAAADIRKSQDNLAVQKIYDEFLGAPNSHKAHEILHTTYIKRGL